MKHLRILLLFFVFSAVAPAWSDSNSSHDTLDNQKTAFQTLASKVRLTTLPNGLRVIMYRRGDAPVFAGVVSTRVGGSDEIKGETGIAHMLEHMAFKGTPEIGTSDYKREKVLLEELEVLAKENPNPQALPNEKQKRWGEIQAELRTLWTSTPLMQEAEKRGAADLNATTDKETTKYFMSLPRPALEFWCWMESERLLHPVLRQFYQERDVVLEERRMRSEDDPLGKLYEMLLGTAYLVHPYRNPVIGYEEDIRSLTAARLEKFRARYYVPGNIVVSLVGDINPESDIDLIEKYFGRLPAGPLPPRPEMVEPQQMDARRVVLRTEASPSIWAVYKKPAYPDPNDPPISIMNEILAGSSVSPLYTELVKKRRLVAGVGTEEGPGNAYPNFFMFTMTPKSPHTSAEALRAFDSVIQKFRSEGPTEEQLRIAKRSIATSYLEQLKTNMGFASLLAETESIYGRWQTIMDWYDEAMAVTAEDVKKAADTYLKPETRTIAEIIRKERK